MDETTVTKAPRKAFFIFVNHIVCSARLAALCFSHSGAQLRQKGNKRKCKMRRLHSGCWIMCVPRHACQTTADHVALPHRSYWKWQATTHTHRRPKDTRHLNEQFAGTVTHVTSEKL